MRRAGPRDGARSHADERRLRVTREGGRRFARRPPQFRLVPSPLQCHTRPRGVAFEGWIREVAVSMRPIRRKRSILRAAISAAFAMLAVLALPMVAAAAPLATIEGTVLDSLTMEPIANATVHIVGGEDTRVPESGQLPDIARVTDSEGRFRFASIPPGTYVLEVRHVSFLPRTKQAIRASTEAGRGNVTIRMAHRTYLMGEVLAEAPPVTPLTSGERASYAIHPAILREFSLDRLADVVRLLPGVTVSGDRPFFRGVGLEQVVPLIDGVPVREPIQGRWVLPPPQAISSAELVSEAFGAEYASALGSVMSFRLAEGDSRTSARTSYRTDRLDISGEPSRRTDIAEIGVSGPTPLRDLFYSASWQGTATDAQFHYDHARPEQTILGTISVGPRMEGNEAASVKLTFRRPEGATKLSAAMVHARDQRKDYHHHYAESGWVGFNPSYDRYTTFLADPADADSAVFFDGPHAVPVSDARSTLGLLVLTARPTAQSSVRVHALYGRHRLNTSFDGIDLSTVDLVRNWTRRGITRTAHQEEWFYATHGSIPEYSWGQSDEGQLGASGSVRVAESHRIKLGMGFTSGRHRWLTVTPTTTIVGSKDRDLRNVDGFGYLEETWSNDRLSSMKLGLRYDFRKVRLGAGSSLGSTWSPVIAFHQPMTERDAFHMQAGLAYQFPVLQPYFNAAPDPDLGIDLAAQRLRFYEVGIQHHIGREMVASIGMYQREYGEIVFSTRSLSALEAAFGVRTLPPQFIDTMGLEVVLDHQLSSTLVGQSSLVWSNTTNNGVEVPWSRRLFARSWLSWHAVTGLLATATVAWDTGRPYTICIKPRGCTDAQLLKGTLPQPFAIDLALRWGPKPAAVGIQLLAEVRNLLNRRIPTFDFGVYPMRVSSANFLAYYHERNETGGYIVDMGNGTTTAQVNNPQTLSAGRQVLLGIEARF